ncbi:serine/threonine-protein kinase [Paludisphaera sp.]|uniref:serine/threonine-protein kinase n=1 Tax=Paludisphaera sp. TaxID=2017432 RepID=UPI00301C7764
MDSRRAAGTSRPPAAPTPRPGDVLGGFVLEEAIGAGGMGAVFRAHDATLDREVALKLLPPDQMDDPEVVRRFYQEGRAAARLDHENIARVFSLGRDGPYHFIIFEYVEGETIRRRVDERGPMSVAEAVDVTLQMAQALVHASHRGVVHRDVKPSNIIITPEGRAKLVDMGLARRFERQGDRGGLTQTGMTLGTFDYISPEQARDPRDVDVRGDLYSLGCTLFHMLTGRPPFPGGTVLQKLLQHQEEPPPDVRELNPDVPPALAKVLDRLMVKDRDRRCQSPEQLVRELLGVAGRVGIPLPRFEAAAAPAERPAWERPMAFATLAGFALLAAGLFYWGRELADPSAPTPAVEYPSLSASRVASNPRPTPPAAGPEAAPLAASSAPRKIDVRPGDDLAAVLASAPHKSVVTLTENGPYLLTGRVPAPRGDARDLTIRAEVGRRPVLRFVADAAGGGDRPGTALLAFTRGRIAIEGLTFEAEGRALDDRLAAIVLDDAELQLTGCSFRRGPGGGPGIPAVLGRVSRPDATGDRPPAIVARQCHFDPGAAAVECRGPADVKLYDCTFGPGGPAVVLDDAGGGAADPRDVTAVRSSFMAGVSPVFLARGPRVGFRVDDCVMAAADPSTPGRVLAMVDSPRDLAWLGRGNLYGPFDAYLRVADAPNSEEAVADFDAWRSGLREDRSVLAAPPVWESPDPARELAQGPEAPARAFRLVAAEGRPSSVGARKGPFGGLIVEPSASDAEPEVALATSGSATPVPTTPAAVAPPTPTTEEPEPPMAATMPPMVNAEPEEPEPTPPVASSPPAQPRRDADAAPARHPDEEDLIRGAEQFRGMIAAARDGDGGELRVAAGAELELTTLALPPGSWTIAAQPGGRRPKLRFHPSPFGSSSAWTALFQVQSGELKLQGLDLLVEDDDHQLMGRLAAVSVAAGASLELSDCTISLVGQAPAHAAIVVPSPRDPNGPGVAGPAVVRLRDGFIRSVGDAVFVAPGQRLDARLDNAVVAVDGSLLHAQGGGPAGDGASLSLKMERVLARAKGGMVHLDGSADEAGLPMAEVTARDSVFSTGDAGAPLFRVDGRGQSDGLADRIRWTGEDVGYHDITTYRADDAGRIGVSPRRYARSDWLVNLSTRDDAPVLDVEFADRKAPALPARDLSPRALRLAPRGPLASKGPDFAAIPPAPGSGS